MASLHAVTVLLLSLSCSVAIAQPPPQCSADMGPVRVVDGQLEFDSLARDNEYDIPDYDAGPLEGWYAMANGFSNVVRPGSLPYCESGREELLGVLICLSLSVVHFRFASQSVRVPKGVKLIFFLAAKHMGQILDQKVSSIVDCKVYSFHP